VHEFGHGKIQYLAHSVREFGYGRIARAAGSTPHTNRDLASFLLEAPSSCRWNSRPEAARYFAASFPFWAAYMYIRFW
jgi:hypothetical protein